MIKYTIGLMFILSFLTGCSENMYFDKTQANTNGELPIEFDLILSDTSNMRAFNENEDVKTSFSNNDVIHILGTFTTKELQQDGTLKDGKISRYGALRYNGKSWEEVSGSDLKWPSVATEGTFKAYYISGSDGVLTDATPSEEHPLSMVTPTSDPLEAATPEGETVQYGHAVRLNFNHICAYLTLIDLEPQVATSYWFYRKNTEKFNNAFRITLGKNDDGPTLNFEFFRQPNTAFKDEDGNPLVYISAATIEDIKDGEKITKVNYFLEPEYYNTFRLAYQAGENSYNQYLDYDYDRIPVDVGGIGTTKTHPDLKAGRTYTLTITKSPGVIITSPPSGEGWDDNGNYFDIEVEKFLTAIYDETDYVNKDNVKILEKTANGTKLLHNVDFNFFNYADFKNKEFVANNKESSVFDGDYHYIRNLGSPLFRYNYGTIQNVGIKTVKIEAESYEDTNRDMSRHGALCMWNRNNATINNVRINDVEMTISVKSDIKPNEDGSETHNIGGVFGSNTGTVSELALSGNFELHVKGVENKPVNSSVLIGGIVGQNAAEGNISDIEPLENNLTINITNECSGDIGSYSVGGIVGESSGTIAGVILSRVRINGSSSKGVTSYMGGIAGQLAVTDGTASINSCIVSGSVTAGTTIPYGNITSGSYIGGIAGADQNVSVVDCRTAVSVNGSTTAKDDDGTIYATGGAFGRIRDSSIYTYRNITAYGSILEGPHTANQKQYIGNFAGIVPKGQTWDQDYKNNNILINSFEGYNPIGGMLDSSNNE